MSPNTPISLARTPRHEVRCRPIDMLLGALRAFAKSRRGGAMLLTGFLGMTLLTSVGALMTNYSWREAQTEELRAALRAAVSSAGQMLSRVTETAVQQQIKERVAGVLGGLTPGLTVSADDVTVNYESDTGITRISIGGTAQYKYQKLWGGDGSEDDVNLPRQTVAVTVDVDRYETVIAADVSPSMGNILETGKTATRMAALKEAIEVAVQAMETASADNTGTMTIGLVPFGSVVNVGDTGGTGETAGKRRYAHLLGGAAHDDASAVTSGHWVDTFHNYGSTGGTWGNDLQTQTLPIFETPKSWELRGAWDIDLTDEAPGFGTWSVQREDFWNGCVMARWGAYWDEDARPDDCVANCQAQCADGDASCTQCAAGCWHSDVSQNVGIWPARSDVDAWTPKSTALTNEPLHLSDAPPNTTDASTRFTAYSWPDTDVSGTADARLHGALLETLNPGKLSDMHIVQYARGGSNKWSFTDSGGDWYCPAVSIQPLVEDATTLRASTDALEAMTFIPNARSGTFGHLGIVWGLRVLSPLWKDIWNTKDAANAKRPLTPCAEDETGTHCRQFVKKTILLISDGENTLGRTSIRSTPVNDGDRGRVLHDTDYVFYGSPSTNNLNIGGVGGTVCSEFKDITSATFGDAVDDTTAAAFNQRFDNLDANDQFSGDSLNGVVAAVEKSMEVTLPTAGKNVLANLTPWDLFRGGGFDADGNSVTDALVNTDNGFGLDGRPVYDDGACRATSSFTSYGRVEDLVQVGGQPVAGVAPYAGLTGHLQTAAKTRLNDWMLDACDLAKQRGVQIKIVFISTLFPESWVESRRRQEAVMEELRKCIDAAGGDRNKDLYDSPTADSLTATFREIFSVRRNLRFLD